MSNFVKRLMTQRRLTEIVRGFVAVAFISLLFIVVPRVSAVCTEDQQTCSNNYAVSESFFGTGSYDYCHPTDGSADPADTEICIDASTGDLVTGNTASANYQAQGGFDTDRMPYVEVTVTKSASDLGVIDATSTGADTAEFSVKSYLSQGYVVQIFGTAPTYAGHTITAMAGVGSTQGTEQFGLNLVANTSPQAIGADPEQDVDAGNPSEPFGFGAENASYSTPNQYRFTSGDTVAASTRSSGYTYYTITYIMNVTNVTPAGTYTANQSVVVTATF